MKEDIQRKVSQLEAFFIPSTEDDDEILVMERDPDRVELDRFDRVYLDSLPVSLL